MPRTFVWAVLGGVFLTSLVAVGCSDGSVVHEDYMSPGGQSSTGATGNAGNSAQQGGEGGMAPIPVGKGVGEACSDADPCRDGLSCGSKGTCEPSGTKAPGDACVIGAECMDGQCVGRMCVPAGSSGDGESCSSDADCAKGLRCGLAGLGLACGAEGSGDLGGDCMASSDCFAGLSCVANKCAVVPGGLPVLGQPWGGVDCSAVVETDVKAYFEVPGAAGADEGDFFRLPFPTDVRKSGNKLDLSGFPTPGAGLLGVDPVQLYVDAITENDSAWGGYPTILFRFSGPIDKDSMVQESTQLYDITDPANAYSTGWQRFWTTARTNYVCENWLAMQPPMGHPLEPGHQYAAFIVRDVSATSLVGAKDQKPVTRSTNMDAVLSDTVPTDAKLKAAHTAFAPMRAFLAAFKDKNKMQVYPPDNVLTATVFTVGDLRKPMTDVAAAVETAAAPTASNWVKCGAAAKSPCPQADGNRGCGDDPAGYDEYQALLSIPIFQQGKEPYSTPADGGGIDVKKPKTEDVCMSITVPEGAAPAAGWPAVVFAHGTGGSYRDHVRDEVAGVLAGATPKFAVIGIDQVEHGPRRGDSMESPNNLFFNFLNPAAARGNPLQGAADQLSVARFVKALNVDAKTTTGAAIKIDGAKLMFFGHSQGSTEGSLMLPFGDDYKAAVLSGNGASLRDALRTKTKPKNIAGALPLVLQDPIMATPDVGPGATIYHPVLSLLQQWIDPADPLNFAKLDGAPLMGHKGKHVFQTFGLDDSYSPPVTMAIYAIAAGIKQVTADKSAAMPYMAGAAAFDDTVAVGYKAANMGFTLGLRQYGAPATSDGHFVVFDVKAANDDMVLFLTGAAGATPPVIGQ